MKSTVKNAKKKSEAIEEISEETITPSCGNVFADLGLPDAETLQLKSALVFQMSQIIKARQWTQAEAAKATGLTQPKISNLLRGNLDSVSAEKLFEVLNRLGCDVEVRVKPRRAPRGQAPAPGQTRTVLAGV